MKKAHRLDIDMTFAGLKWSNVLIQIEDLERSLFLSPVRVLHRTIWTARYRHLRFLRKEANKLRMEYHACRAKEARHFEKQWKRQLFTGKRPDILG